MSGPILGGCGVVGPGQRPNVILIVIDTLRADHLGCYGYGRATSPSIDDLAARGLRFENAVSTASFTKPATASILTGLYPTAHGAISNTAHGLAEDVPLLASLLQDVGYFTAGFYRNGSVKPVWGFGRGFDVYEMPDKEYAAELGGDAAGEDRPVWVIDDRAVTFKAEPLLRTVESPFFLYLHLIGPHDPYTPPRDSTPFLEGPLHPIAARFYEQTRQRDEGEKTVLGLLREGRLPIDATLEQQLVALYDGEILISDQQVGAVVRVLEESGLLDESVVIVTSDHGEEFLEHGGLGHGYTHHREVLRVPLVIAGPGVSRGVVEQPVSMVDLMPTVLEMVGVEVPEGIDGRSFAPSVADSAVAPAPRPLYAEGLLRFYWQDPLLLRSVRSGGLKLTLDFRRHRKQLFDVESDRKESVNLLPDRAEDGRRLLADLIDIHERNLERRTRLSPRDVDVPQELEQELRALGYLGTAKKDEVLDPFSQRLLIADLEPYGLMGDERRVRTYAAAVDFRDEGFDPEQLLYGWSQQPTAPRWMRRRAGVVLGRRPEHQRWQVRGRAPAGASDAEPLELEVRIDGGPPRRFEIDAPGRFAFGGRLPGGERSQTRLDLACGLVESAVPEGGRRDEHARCVTVRSIELR